MTDAELERLAGFFSERLRNKPLEESDRARMLDAREAGARLGVPPTWLLAQARAKSVPHRRFGKYVRFHTDDIAEISARVLRSAER